VLTEELLIGGVTRTVVLWVPPAKQEIAPSLAIATRVPGSFSGRRAVVDDPHLIQGRRAHQDLIELLVVVDRVHVDPVRPGVASSRIDVHELRVVGNDAKIVFRRVEILDQVVPQVPLPNDGSRRRSRLLDLDNVLWPQRVVSLGEDPRPDAVVFPRSNSD